MGDLGFILTGIAAIAAMSHLAKKHSDLGRGGGGHGGGRATAEFSSQAQRGSGGVPTDVDTSSTLYGLAEWARKHRAKGRAQ